MKFDPTLAAIRFGTGLSPRHDLPRSAAQMIRVAGLDKVANQFPIPTFDQVNPPLWERAQLLGQFRRNRRDKIRTPEALDVADRFNAAQQTLREARFQTLRNTVARGAYARFGLSERLVMFWADHFTALSKGFPRGTYYGDFLDAAIRPNILGKFSDMLKAVTSHPLMIHYLDQGQSVGPNSTDGIKHANNGLNENMARELLELHTLGVDGPYGQDDVNGLAMLLTGLTEYIGRGFRWHRPIVEPGEHDVLGKTYGDDAVIRPQIDRLFGVLDDLATHPSTARHLCEKMARHFVADDPDPELVAAMVSEYQASGGDLQRITEVMMDHPAAWQQDHPNVKWPLDYVMSTFRAINLPPRVFDNMPWKTVRRVFHAPLVQMGQAWIGANGPDGYPELDERWITPQGLAARLDWALMAPGEILKALPDPRKVAVDALGARLPESVKFAVSASDQRREGLALVLVSPAFQRR